MYQMKQSKLWMNCWRWDCPECGKVMREHWARQLVEVTKGQNLYLFKGSRFDFNRPLKAIIEQDADYANFNCEKELIVITNKHILDAKPISEDKHEFVIREAIEKTWSWEWGYRAYVSPIHASKNWSLPKEKLSEPIEFEED